MKPVIEFIHRNEKILKNVDLLIAITLVCILAVMLIPMPAYLLDFSLSLSLMSAILVLLVAIYTQRSLDFSVFPSLLLILTLYRLALNVATTRLVLSEGHTGEGAAGSVINAFGNFVVGDNYVIGFIVFVILVVINFVVITKGSGRVAEVAARFTLDAMPGKQMSIDADLNSGIITDQEAKERRKEIESQADFYGAMDGASKFVRGDAIAGIVITLVNIVGGLFIGMFQYGLDAGTAAQYYTMLTIGDGLVSQIPALIISTAAGIIVTRTSSGRDMGQELFSQLLFDPRSLFMGGAILFFMGLVPGLPGIPFFLVAMLMGGVGFVIHFYKEDLQNREQKRQDEAAVVPERQRIENLLPVDLVELEVGYGLINVVESKESGDLLERIISIRKTFAIDMGIIVPSIHIRDNLQLQPGEYRLLIKGAKVAGGALRSDSLLAMDPGNLSSQIDGTPTKEPAFGLDALWITKGQKEEAELAGYTVVDLPTVMATHITEVIRIHAYELLGRQEAGELIDNFKKSYPRVVEELIPEGLPFGVVVKVLQSLLKEQVSIRDLLTIFETLADEASRTKDPEILTETVRKSLHRVISTRYKDEEGKITVMTLSPHWEERVSNSLLQTEQGVQLVMEPKVAHQMIDKIVSAIETTPQLISQPVLLTNPTSRRHLFKLLHRFIPQLVVISHSELSNDIRLTQVATVE